MPKLPQVKYRQVEQALLKSGFTQRPAKGSHVFFKHPDGRRTAVPNHPKPIPKGTLRAILHQAGINLDEFLKLI